MTDLVVYNGDGSRKVIGTVTTVVEDGEIKVKGVVTDLDYIHLIDDGSNSHYSIGPLNANVPTIP